MRYRIERCRRLARLMTDERTIDALNELADDIEADLRKLEAEAGITDVQTIHIGPPRQS